MTMSGAMAMIGVVWIRIAYGYSEYSRSFDCEKRIATVTPTSVASAKPLADIRTVCQSWASRYGPSVTYDWSTASGGGRMNGLMFRKVVAAFQASRNPTKATS